MIKSPIHNKIGLTIFFGATIFVTQNHCYSIFVGQKSFLSSGQEEIRMYFFNFFSSSQFCSVIKNFCWHKYFFKVTGPLGHKILQKWEFLRHKKTSCDCKRLLWVHLIHCWCVGFSITYSLSKRNSIDQKIVTTNNCDKKVWWHKFVCDKTNWMTKKSFAAINCVGQKWLSRKSM